MNYTYVLEILGFKKDESSKEQGIQTVKDFNIGIEDKEFVVLGIRPNYISFGNDKEVKMKGEIILKEMLGSEAYIHIETEHGETVTVIPTMDIDSSLDKETHVNFTFNTDMINSFDIESGENLILRRSKNEN